MTITPMQIEKRLTDLSREIEEAHKELVSAEHRYYLTKATFEIDMAKSRIRNSHPDMKMTVAQRDDQALVENASTHTDLAVAEAQVKAARANVNRIRTQVDIARSVSVSVRSSLDM